MWTKFVEDFRIDPIAWARHIVTNMAFRCSGWEHFGRLDEISRLHWVALLAQYLDMMP